MEGEVVQTLADMSGIDSFPLPSFVHIPRDLTSYSKEEKIRRGKEKSGFIQEVKYPSWLSNVVMVKKSSGKWRMCTDYTDLNRTCPKDPYLLPNIDALVDGASNCGLLSFIDTYSGYNQIRMHPSDESKTVFITDEGNFYYRVMSFGLKNVRATYQRLMDQIFKDHISNQLEIYVDNMVVNSKTETRHAESLALVFKVLRRYHLKLNPEKCSFRIKVNKFLGGIKVSPENCNAVIDMRSPKSVKEVQQLADRIKTLARFLLGQWRSRLQFSNV
ncbi:hypothetical protein CR513_33780, partial [Mucuna pruriens]